jgi:hypothetical protein
MRKRSRARPPASIAAGTRIGGRYRLAARLAGGGSAEIWRAHDQRLDRDVALKLPHPHLVAEARTRRQLAAEARAAAGLTHPGIVRVYDVVADGPQPAVVLELVEGESLATRLDRQGRLPPTEVARIGAQVGDALLHAHGHGVVHRDIKPGNILIDPGGQARLVDFGIARLLDEAAERLTLTGTVAGTMGYMAPEQLAGGEITPRTDVYALGAVLFRALTGRLPFEATSPVALAEAQRNGPPPAAELPVDPALAAIVLAALSPDPADRPRTAGALAEALRDWLDGRPTEAMAAIVPPPVAISADAPTIVAPVVAPAAVPPAVIEAPTVLAARRAAPAAARGAGAGPGWRRGAVAAVATMAVVLALVIAARGPGEPASTETPTPTISATPVPTPTPAPSVGVAVAEFKDLVSRAREQGLLEGGAADDLLDRADEIAEKAEEGKYKDVTHKIRELRRRIEEFDREGRIPSADLVASLQTAVDEIEAAAERQQRQSGDSSDEEGDD